MFVFGYDIGTFTFFAFSFLAAIFIAASAIFGCKEETTVHRWTRGILGFAYLFVTYVAFVQLEVADSFYQQLLPFVMMRAGCHLPASHTNDPNKRNSH
ncbi:MAG: hypothetical protein GDA45_05890 [Chromatiales bacterium]|nr:hypothetical protein [Chromatiales bacterium]